MKFDYCIGNPPYQISRDTTKDMPVYNDFMDAAYTVSDKVELITPARFLFNAGATPKPWNRKMLDDDNFKVLDYEPDSDKVFPSLSTPIKGGVAIHYHDATQKFGAIGMFAHNDEINELRKKLSAIPDFVSLNTIMYPYSTYTLSETFWNEHPDLKSEVEYISKHRKELSKEEKEGKLSNFRIITTNIFDLLVDEFFDVKPNDGDDYVCLMGRQNNARCSKYIKARYIDVGDNYSKWKVLTPKTNGSGNISDTFASPIIVAPNVGYTQTYLGIGALNSEQEAKALYKYFCSKFARACLSILKVTQDNPPERWAYVPLQDFTSNSDIDWNQSIADIDKQLYRKYGLSQDEIDFIETHVKEMN